MYHSKRQMKKAFREGQGVYADGQSSYSPACQEARQRGRLPMTEAIKFVRMFLGDKGIKVSVKRAREALQETHDGEWHHTSKYGNRTPYYDPLAAVDKLLPQQNAPLAET